MSDTFRNQFLRYIRNEASAHEIAELEEQVRSGRYDQVINEILEDLTRSEFDRAKEDDPVLRDKIFRQALATIQESGKVVPFRQTTSWRWMAAAAVTLALTVSGLWFYQEYNFGSATDQSITTVTGKDYVRLPDGTAVMLNEGSTLAYGTSYGTDTREVTLTGEAFFDVQHDAAKPFEVHTGSVTTKVLGTAFNIREADQQIIVTVARGLVEVSSAQQTYGRIQPNEQLTVNTQTNNVVTATVQAEKVTEWKSAYMLFESQPLQEVARQLGERYGVTVTVAEPMRDCLFTARFLEGEDLQTVLLVITDLFGSSTFSMDKQGNAILTGKGCN